jgi:type I restriction enzyme, S subunit
VSLTVSPAEIVSTSTSPLLAKHPDWPRVELREVADVINGAAYASRFFNREGEGLPLVRIRDVGKQRTETFYAGPYEERHVLDDGDLLIGMDGDFRIAEWNGGSALLNQRVCKLVVKNDAVLPRFLLYLLPGYLDAVHAHTSSVTVKHLSSNTVLDLPIPLPRLEEQRVLVKEIEKQFARLDFASNALERSRLNLRRWKSSTLRESFSGEQSSSRPLRTICSVHIGATPSRTVEGYWRGDIPWVVSKDLHSRFITETAERISQAGLANTSTEVHPVGTVLLGMIGQGPTRGLAALLKVPACTSQNLAALRPREDGEVLPEWLLYWLDSQYEYLRSLGSGNNQKALNKRVVESILVPLPSVEQQRDAVDRIEVQLSALEAIEQAVAVSARRLTTLKQKFLSDVFRGALVGLTSSAAGNA